MTDNRRRVPELLVFKEHQVQTVFGALNIGDEFLDSSDQRWMLGLNGTGHQMLVGMSEPLKGQIRHPNDFQETTLVLQVKRWVPV